MMHLTLAGSYMVFQKHERPPSSKINARNEQVFSTRCFHDSSRPGPDLLSFVHGSGVNIHRLPPHVPGMKKTENYEYQVEHAAFGTPL
jgi:hypothetical protein